MAKLLQMLIKPLFSIKFRCVCPIKNGHRLTLGIKFVLPAETAKEIIEYLLKQLQRLELEARVLYLDRGFGSIEIARYLKEISQTAIIACPSARKNRRVESLVCGQEKLSHQTPFQESETRSRRSRNGDVQGIYDHYTQK